ncbi:MAG: hypothetical protein ACOX5R_08225 [bacterium]
MLHKFNENIARDRLAQKKLKELGWKVIVIWECQINQALRRQLPVDALSEKQRTPRGKKDPARKDQWDNICNTIVFLLHDLGLPVRA